MIRFIISMVFLGFVLTGTAQDYIGMRAEEIRKQMRAGRKDFSLDETTVNKVYKYLKYVDDMETRTILFFLSDDDRCTWYKVIYDNDFLGPVVQHLDSTCRKISDTLWMEEINGHQYRKELKKQEWFFSVTTRPDMQEARKEKKEQ
jgi:hypothetical protein